MDICGKMNAEFRNEVNEALARHESSFDQINLALQVVLMMSAQKHSLQTRDLAKFEIDLLYI